jgi:cardiolipin synthase
MRWKYHDAGFAKSRRTLLCAAVSLGAIVLGLTSCTSQLAFEPSFPYTALEATRDGSKLQLKYLGPDGLAYSLADWTGELDTGVPGADGVVSLLVMNPAETTRAPALDNGQGIRLPVLSSADYHRVRAAVLKPILPEKPLTGVVVDISGTEIVLWHDGDGVFQSSSQAPADIEISNRLSLEQYLSNGPAIVEQILAEHGIDAREALFNTGDTGQDALPFLYANVDSSTAAFVRIRPLGLPRAQGGNTLVPLTQTLFHIVRSHTTGLISQPVSSVFRLMFMVTDAAVDTLDPAWTLQFDTQQAPPIADSPGMDLATWEDELDRLLGRGTNYGTVDYLIDGQAYFTRLEQAVEAARESIDLRTYIFDNDDYALEFADLLKRRSADDIDIKVLMDGFGTLTASSQMPPELPEGFKPPASIYGYLREDSKVKVRDVVNPFFTGDHTKTTIIDEKIAFLGGMNVGREYRSVWHDMMAEVRGPVVAELGDDFDYAWASASPLGDLAEFARRIGPGRKAGEQLGYPVRVLYTRPTSSEIRNAQLAAIRRARDYIFIENAYFTDDNFLYELVQARRRGVDVRVIIPMASDRGVLTQDNILAANAMFRNGIRIYIYPGMSHVKAAVYDGWACLGSANIDQLSLRVNREANIATSAPEAVEPLLEELFEVDFRSSPEMTEEFPVKWHGRLWEIVGDYIF